MTRTSAAVEAAPHTLPERRQGTGRPHRRLPRAQQPCRSRALDGAAHLLGQAHHRIEPALGHPHHPGGDMGVAPLHHRFLDHAHRDFQQPQQRLTVALGDLRQTMTEATTQGQAAPDRVWLAHREGNGVALGWKAEGGEGWGGVAWGGL